MEVTTDFNDIFWEPPGTEFQPLLEFEEEIQREVPYNDISILTQRIKRSFLDYVRQGIMLDAVRRYRLYKRQYRDFAEYCKVGLGLSPYYCKRIIEAAEVCLRLIKAKFKILPTSVAQALPLAKFAKVDEYGQSELQQKWQTVLDEFPPQNITAVKIQEALDENPESRSKQVRISGQAYRLLQKNAAAAAGMAISKYLEMVIGGGEPPDDEPPDNDKYETVLTPEKEAICDRAEAFVKKLSANPRVDRTASPTHPRSLLRTMSNTYTYQHSELPPVRPEIQSEIVALDVHLADLVLKIQGNYRERQQLAEVLTEALNTCEINLQSIRIVPDDAQQEIGLKDLRLEDKELIYSISFTNSVLLNLLSDLTRRKTENIGKELAQLFAVQKQTQTVAEIDKLITQLTLARSNVKNVFF